MELTNFTFQKSSFMKPLFRTGLFLFLLIFSFSIYGQQYLVVQKPGKVKNFKYEVGDEIMINTRKGDLTLSGEITDISDTCVTINTYIDVGLSNIAKVLRPRRFFTKLSKLFFIRGGIAYVTIVGINGIINNDSPLIDEQTLTISASMVAIGLAMKPLYIRKLDTTGKWALKVIDFDNIPDEQK